jgi:hypothetical protein
MRKPSAARGCLWAAGIALALLGLLMILLPSTTPAGCPHPGVCLERVNPYKVWLGMVCALTVVWGVVGAWMLPQRKRRRSA